MSRHRKNMFNQLKASASPLTQVQGFDMELQNLDQFFDLIRGESEDKVFNIDRDVMVNGCFVDDHFGSSNPEDFLDINGVPGPDGEDIIKGREEDDQNDGEDSSATTATITNETTGKRVKADRSRTLISERRRRGRMKEKLYALRSLVPNITKMDKASIVGDAVLYVQELQMQVKKLKAEIMAMEESTGRAEGVTQNPEKIHRNPRSTCSAPKKIIGMHIFQVEERGFYLRIVCEKGYGVATSLYKVLESMKGFNVQISNFATETETFVLTATLNVIKDCEQEMNLTDLKVCLSGALLDQGFEFKSPVPNS